MSSSARSRDLVDHPQTGIFEFGNPLPDVVDRKCQVVEPFAAGFQELRDGA